MWFKDWNQVGCVQGIVPYPLYYRTSPHKNILSEAKYKGIYLDVKGERWKTCPRENRESWWNCTVGRSLALYSVNSDSINGSPYGFLNLPEVIPESKAWSKSWTQLDVLTIPTKKEMRVWLKKQTQKEQYTNLGPHCFSDNCYDLSFGIKSPTHHISLLI